LLYDDITSAGIGSGILGKKGALSKRQRVQTQKKSPVQTWLSIGRVLVTDLVAAPENAVGEGTLDTLNISAC